MADIKNTRELSEMVNDYQKEGTETPVYETQQPFKFESLDDLEYVTDPNDGGMPITLNEILNNKISVPGMEDRNQFLEAAGVGFGGSRLDKRFGFQEGKDLEDLRAREQSFANKILSGLGKGAVTTLTTAANSTVGLVAGAGSSLFESVRAIFDPNEEFTLQNIVDAGTNNAVSKKLIDIQTKMEEVMPNYRTAEERTDQYQDEWYKHMLTGNFIGDSFIKNFGFTLGAMGAGMMTSKALSRLFSRKLSADLMRGVVSSAAGDAVANQELVQLANAIRSNGGVTGLDVEKLLANARNAGRTIRNAQIATQLTGATIAALGEGTVEGLMAQSEFLQNFIPKMQQQYAEAINLIDSDLQREHPEWFRTQIQYDAYGNPTETAVLVSEEGKQERLLRQQELAQKYDTTMKYVEQQGRELATTTCALNLPILLASDLFQFGKAFGGGWQTARRNLPTVSGGIRYDMAGNAVAEYAGTGKKALRALGESAKVALTEANEEMVQGYVSSGAKEVADRRLTYFADCGYDPEALAGCADWLDDMVRGGNEYITKSASWQEGAIGAFTGMLGIPSRHLRTWHGGIPEAIRTTRAQEQASREAANRLNDIINSEDFQKRWRGYIRHLAFDEKKGKAAEEGNQYAWHNADMQDLINDIVMFADAGRLDDLDSWVDHVESLGKQDIQEIRDFMKSNHDTQTLITDNTPDDVILDKVHKKAESIRDMIKNYRTVFEDLSSVVNPNLSSDRLRELVFTGMELRGFEDRFHQMLNETMTVIDPILQLSATQDGKGGQTTDAKEIAENLKSLQEQYNRAFSGNVTASFFDLYTESQLNEKLDQLERAAENWDKDNNTKWATTVKDMRRIAADRRELIRKIASLRTMTDQQFDEMKTTSAKIAEAVEESQTQQEASEFKTVEDVRKAIRNVTNMPQRFAYSNKLERLRSTNPAIEEYFKIEAVRKSVNKLGFNSPTSEEERDVQRVAKILLETAAANATTAQELLNLNANSKLLLSEDEALRDMKTSATSTAKPDEYWSNVYQQAIDLSSQTLKQAQLFDDNLPDFEFNRDQSEQPQDGTAQPQSSEQGPADDMFNFGTRGKKPGTKPAPKPQVVPAPKPQPKPQPKPADNSRQEETVTPQIVTPYTTKQLKDALDSAPQKKVGDRWTVPDLPRFNYMVNKPGDILVDEKGHLMQYNGSRTLENGMVTHSFTNDKGETTETAIAPTLFNYDEVVKLIDASKPASQPQAQPAQETDPQNQGQAEVAHESSMAPDAPPAVEVPKDQLYTEGELAFEEKPVAQYEPGGELLGDSLEQDFEQEAHIVTLAQRPYRAIDEEDLEDPKFPEYYNTAIPECMPADVLASINKVRFLQKNKDKDEEFVDVHIKTPRSLPEGYPDGRYDTVWNYLMEHGAFDNMDRVVARKSRISFVIDPTFKDDKGNTPILLATVDDNGVHILNILRENTEDSKMNWVGLDALREAIVKEYNASGVKEYKNGKFFVFSKTSNCWAKRPGVITYLEKNSLGFADRPITQIEGYNPNAQIVVIRKDSKSGTYYFSGLTGSVNADTLKRMDKNFLPGLIESARKLGKSIAGRIYYLAPTTLKTTYTPIKCNIEHFNNENHFSGEHATNPAYMKIYDCAEKLASLYHDYHEGRIIESAVDIEVRKIFNDLNSVLDCWNLYLSIGTSKDLGDTLRFSFKETEKDSEGNKVQKGISVSELTGEGVTAENIARVLAKRNLPFQFRINWDGNMEGRAKAVREFIANGLLTSNAAALRERGVDLYFNIWDNAKGDFEEIEPKVSDSQTEQEMEIASGKSSDEFSMERDGEDLLPVSQYTMPAPEEQSAVTEQEKQEEMFDDAVEAADGATEVHINGTSTEATSEETTVQERAVNLPEWSELSEQQKGFLATHRIKTEKGYKSYIARKGEEAVAKELACK